MLLAGGGVTNKPVATKVVVDPKQLEYRDGLMYFEGKAFKGVAVAKYLNGQKEFEITFKDGKAHGLKTTWYNNGQKISEITFKDGKAHGLWTQWYENGQKQWEGTSKDGKWWSAPVWKPNGEKCPDTNVVNGNGIMCWYHDNGQKEFEETYKDGKEISEKGWDEDGNPR